MTDIVERLRAAAKGLDGLLSAQVNDIPVLADAAAEIERLQVALEVIADGFNGCEVAAVTLQEIARRAINPSVTANEEQ